MYMTIRILAFLSFLSFLLVGLASAGIVEILSPATGDALGSGKANPIIVDINWSQLTSYVARYKLSYRTSVDQKWKIITNRYCRISGQCSDSNPCCATFYPWEVSHVAENKYNCQLKVVLFDVNGNKLAKNISGTFTILAYGTTQSLSISPHSRTVAPGGVDYYWITYGQPPYTVDTSEHSISTVYEGSEPMIPPMPPVTINSNMFSVKNQLYSCPGSNDITINITVTDSTNSIATASYIIDCTP